MKVELPHNAELCGAGEARRRFAYCYEPPPTDIVAVIPDCRALPSD